MDDDDGLSLLQTYDEYFCDKCNNRLELLLTEDATENNDKTIFIKQIFGCDNGILPLVCKRCLLYYGACRECSGIGEIEDFYDIEKEDLKHLQFCQFLGCRGETVDGIDPSTTDGYILRPNSRWDEPYEGFVYKPTRKQIIVSHLGKVDSVYENEPRIAYYVGDKDLNYVAVKELEEKEKILITGTCGGESHHWRCNGCCRFFDCTDL